MDTGESFPRIVLIGTGAAANADRCQACVAVQSGPDYTLLLDTGSGVEVVRNLKRAGIALDTVQGIFLSHRHSDHIGGLELLMLHCGLHALSTGKHANQLDVYGHSLVLEVARQMISSMGSVAPKLFGQTGERLDWLPLSPGQPADVNGGVRLLPFIVDHAPPDGSCWGCLVEIQHDGGILRIVYSGDTRPTPPLSRHAAGATVILHECGGLDEDAERVHHVGHSTAGDAARLAAAAGAQHLVLLHLPGGVSARAMRREAAHHFTGQITIGKDLGRVHLR